MSAIGDFLTAIQPPVRTGEQIEARYIRQGAPIMTRHYSTLDALTLDAHRLAPIYNAYFGVTLRRIGGSTAEDCTRAGALWGDFDAKLYADTPDPLASALAALDRFPLPAGVVVCSAGGYHGYWPLRTPADVRDASTSLRVEQLNAALARAVCGPDRQPDHVQDVARILRLPDTLNHKTVPPRPVEVVWIRPERRYTLHEVEALLQDRYPWSLCPTTSKPTIGARIWMPPSAPPRDVDERARRRISPAMRALLEGTGTGGRKSGSEADQSVACALIGAGLTEAEALAVLLASPRAADHANRKRGSERQEIAYWRRTVGNAAAHVGPVTVRTDARRVRPTRTPYRRTAGALLMTPRGGAS